MARTLIVGDRRFDFDPMALTNKEGMDIERVTDMTFDQWCAALEKGSISGVTVLVWILRRREEPGLRLGDVEFQIGDIDSEETAELAELDRDADPAEVVPGGFTAEFDASDPTPAPEAYTSGA